MVKMDKSFGEFKIHNVGFYNLAPRGIKCLSYNQNKYKLAVARLVFNKSEQSTINSTKLLLLKGRCIY